MRLIKIPRITGVAASSTAVVDLPRGDFSYAQLFFSLGGTFVTSDLTTVRVLANGDAIQDWGSASDLEAVQAFYGANVGTTAQFGIPFWRPHLNNSEVNRAFMLGTLGIDSLQVEIGIDGTPINPTLGCHGLRLNRATADAPSANRPGVVSVWKKFSYAPSAAGDFEISDIPRQGQIAAVHIKSASGNINYGEVRLDDVIRWETDSDALHEWVAESTVPAFVRQTNWHHIPLMDMERTVGGQLLVAESNDLRVKLNMSAADTLTVYVNYLRSFGG